MTSNRERFEEWYLAEFWEGSEAGQEYLAKEPCGGYTYAKPQELWKVWQAAQPAGGDPVYQWHDETAWQECHSKREYLHAKDNGIRVRILWTTPPAAAPLAADEPVAEFFVEFDTLRKAMSIYGLAAPASNSELGALMERYAVELIEAVADRPFPYPPAAAYGDEAVLWELLEELRTATDRQALPGAFIRVMWEAGCDWINARAAMRAQGDGEVQ